MAALNRVRVVFKCAALLTAAAGLVVVVYRLEDKRPVLMLERAGATLLTNQDGEFVSISLTGDAAGDDQLRHIASIETLKRVNLSGARVTSDGLKQLQTLPALEELDISETLRADGALAVISQFPALRTLHVRRCDWLDDSEISSLSGSSTLEQIVFMRNPITDKGVSQLTSISNLTHLWLTGCTHLSDAGVGTLAGLPRLKQLSLDDCSGLTADSLWTCADFPAIEAISINNVTLDRQSTKRFTETFPGIEVAVTKLDASDLAPLTDRGAVIRLNRDFEPHSVAIDGQSRRGLVALSPSYELRLTDSDILENAESLDGDPLGLQWSGEPIGSVITRHAPHVNVLDLRRIRLSSEDFSELARLTELRVLAFDEIDGPRLELSFLQRLPHLRTLSLANLDVSEQCLVSLAQHSALSHIEFHNVTLSTQSLLLLQQNQKLERLSIHHESHAHEFLSALGGFPGLRALRIAGKLPEDGLPWLAELDQLDILRIENGTLSHQACHDAAQAAELQQLSLRNVVIPQGGLEAFAELANLRAIHFQDCRFDQEDLRRLRALHPQVELIADGLAQTRRAGLMPIPRLPGRSSDPTDRFFFRHRDTAR